MLFNHYDLDDLVALDHELRRIKEKLLVKKSAEERERWKNINVS